MAANKLRYQIRENEAGNIISKFETFSEALEEYNLYIRDDIRDSKYVRGFYEIYDSKEKVIKKGKYI